MWGENVGVRAKRSASSWEQQRVRSMLHFGGVAMKPVADRDSSGSGVSTRSVCGRQMRKILHEQIGSAFQLRRAQAQ